MSPSLDRIERETNAKWRESEFVVSYTANRDYAPGTLHRSSCRYLSVEKRAKIWSPSNVYEETLLSWEDTIRGSSANDHKICRVCCSDLVGLWSEDRPGAEPFYAEHGGRLLKEAKEAEEAERQDCHAREKREAIDKAVSAESDASLVRTQAQADVWETVTACVLEYGAPGITEDIARGIATIILVEVQQENGPISRLVDATRNHRDARATANRLKENN